jgi:hypothetical protein
MGPNMSSRSEALASLLSFLVFDDLAGDEFDSALYSEQSGVPLAVVERDLERLRKRGCLTPDWAIDWPNMPQAQLWGVLEWMHGASMRELGGVIHAWAQANPGKFEGWTATADYMSDAEYRACLQ